MAATLTLAENMARLHALADPAVAAGLARFGSHPAHMLGVRMPLLRGLAKGQRSHALALELWQSGVHEARILASLVDDPAQVTREQIESWTADFDTWDVCDQVCGNLFDRTPFAFEYALGLPACEGEYVRRAGFVLMAWLPVHRKDLPDADFLPFFPLIEQYAFDGRNFVKKAVNWALRGLGKASPVLHAEALRCAERVAQQDSPSARWIAADALRELNAVKRFPKRKGSQ